MEGWGEGGVEVGGRGRAASGLGKGRQQEAAGGFCRSAFSREVCARINWQVLIGQISPCHQIMTVGP